jgi:hypothetical protein
VEENAASVANEVEELHAAGEGVAREERDHWAAEIEVVLARRTGG